MSLQFTKNQISLLALFFNHPEKAYYLRELGRMLGKAPGVFQRDINELTQQGFLQDYYQAKSRFFKLNARHPLYQELKSIFFKTVGVEGALKRALAKIPGIKQAFIYGSFARGEEISASDIDLMIIGRVSEDILIDTLNLLENKFDREIHYVLMTLGEFQKKKKDSFLRNILMEKKIKLI